MDKVKSIDVKVFAAQGSDIAPEEFVAVLQRWIREHTVPGVLVDVADYSHMHHGPGVILVGHEANTSIDYAEGRMGLLYRYRQIAEDDFDSALKTAVAAAMNACKLLEAENEFNERLKFDAGSVHVIANDRLTMPNSDAAFDRLKSAVAALAGSLYESAAVSRIEADPRERLGVAIQAAGPVDAATAHDALSAAAAG